MKLGMVQMCMSRDATANEEKALRFCDEAKGCDLVFFPEVQYAPFFAQYPVYDAEPYLVQPDGPEVQRLRQKAQQHGIWCTRCQLFRGFAPDTPQISLKNVQ